MKRRTFIWLLAFAVLFGSGFMHASAEETVQEEIGIPAGKPITFPLQEKVAVLAVNALKHIAKARGFIHDGLFAEAKRELKSAQEMMEDIRASLPTTRIKDHIWVARKHLSYDASEDVLQDLIPIYASLDEIQSFVTVDETRKQLDDAKNALENDNKERGAKALKLAEESLVYVEIDLPLSFTERKVAEALHLLAEGKETDAGLVLKDAEDGVQVISIASYGPMVLAQESLWQATKEYAKGKYEAALKYLSDAKAYLKMAARQADEKTREALDKLNRKIEELETKMGDSGSDFSKETKGLWEKTKDVYHETVEKFKK